MPWNQQTNCDRYVSNNSPVVPEPAEDTCVQKCVKSTRQFVRYDTNPNNDFKSRKRYEVLPKLNTELADNKYSWGSLTLSVLDSIPTNAIDFHTGSTILGYLAFFLM